MKKKQLKLPSFTNIIIVILVTFSILSIASSTGGKKLNFLGYRPVLVVSGSMLPSIQINSISIMKYCDIDEIEVGDVIMYYHPSLKINITHRVIAMNGSSDKLTMTVKGDANSVADDIAVTNDMLVGKLVATYNQTVPIVNLIIQDGKVNKPILIGIMLSLAMLITVISLIFSWLINVIAITYLILAKKWNIEWYEIGVEQLGIQSSLLEYANRCINRQPNDSIGNIIAKIILALQLNKIVSTSRDVTDSYKTVRILSNKELLKSLGLVKDLEGNNEENESGINNQDKEQ